MEVTLLIVGGIVTTITALSGGAWLMIEHESKNYHSTAPRAALNKCGVITK